MKDENTIEINMQMATVGIMGLKTVERRSNGDVIETRTGSATHKFIHPFFLVVEDDLAVEVIDTIACDLTNISRKYIKAGVYGNQAACLFGFLLYAEQLKGTNVPPFSILAIDDGDIGEKQKEKRLDGLLKGNYYGDALKKAKVDLSELLLSFNLEYLNCGVTKGLPEYNHKRWLEEIDRDVILAVDKPSDLYGDRQIESLLELIQFSKSIVLDDYHNYYNELQKCPLSNTLTMFHKTQYFVLKTIKKYNNKKWQFYTAHIKEKLISISEKNVKNFIDADVYFKK